MKKDFQKWHNKKSQIDQIEKRPFFHEREIWFCHFGDWRVESVLCKKNEFVKLTEKLKALFP